MSLNRFKILLVIVVVLYAATHSDSTPRHRGATTNPVTTK